MACDALARWSRHRNNSVGEHRAEFCERFEDVTDEQWENCDGIVTVNDVPAEYRAKLKKCRIVVTPKVGFDNLDLAAWGALDCLCATCLTTVLRKSPTMLWR